MKKKILLQDISDFISAREGTTKKKSDTFVRAFFEMVERGLLEDKFVKIKGFGTFKLVSVSERESVNINTGERFQISGHTKVSFTPDPVLKDLVNRPFAHFEAVDLNDETDVEELAQVDNETVEMEEESDDADEGVMQEEDGAESVDESVNQPISETTEDAETSQVSENTEEPEALEISEPSNASELSDLAVELLDLEKEGGTSPSTENTENEDAEENEVETEEEKSEENGHLEKLPEVDETREESSEEKGDARQATVFASDTGARVSDGMSEACDEGEGITVQSTSHATAMPLHFTYEQVPSRRRVNWWRVVSLSFIILLLMGASYFAGYYRLLCPCTYFPNVSFNEFLDAHTQRGVREEPELSEDIDTLKPAAGLNVATTPVVPKVADIKQTAQQKSVTAEVPDAAAVADDRTTAEASLEGWRGTRIVGTQQTYRVTSRDNLSRIARRFYGSDKYVSYIIRHNGIDNPDSIEEGAVLKLPKMAK